MNAIAISYNMFLFGVTAVAVAAAAAATCAVLVRVCVSLFYEWITEWQIKYDIFSFIWTFC